tara:strand:- start:4983 stop:5975 length:993 start_codon:yes stop_codon:yes gene_type:complete
MLEDFGAINYLCFSGGGGYGLMFVGGLEAVIRKRNLNMNLIKGCIGTSAGALTAFWVASGMSYERFLEVALEYDYCNLAPKVDLALLVNHYGMDEGAKLMEVIEVVIEAAGMSKNITFSDLFRLTKRHFVCVASNMDTAQAVYLDHLSHPSMEIKLAIRASMGLPLVFPPRAIDGVYHVDGAITDNFPIDFFPIEHTLIFGVTVPQSRMCGWREYGISVLSCGIVAQKKSLIRRLNAISFHSHFIDLPVPAFDVKLTEIRKDVAVFGFYHMLLTLCPEISSALNIIVLHSLMIYLRMFRGVEDALSSYEPYSECESRLLVSTGESHSHTI